MPFTVKEWTRRQCENEPGSRTIYEWSAAKQASGWEMVKAIKWWKKQNRSYPLACFVKKFEKNVPIINNDGEHAKKIEGGVSSLQLFSCNHEADIRIALTANFVVLLNNSHFNSSDV